MATSFNTRISLKYDTYEQWHTNNPALLKGELAIVEVPDSTGVAQNEPTYLLKVGDGENKFDDLKWISGHAADVYAWAKAATKPTYQASEITGLDDYISGKVQDTNTKYQIIKNGDMGFKLQSKELNGEWTDVNEITLVAPTYTLKEGTENGTVKFNGIDVKVHGLGSAAYTESSAYDAAGTGASEAGKAKTELVGRTEDTSNKDTIKGAKKYAEEKASAAQSAANGYTDSKISELNIGQYATTEAMNGAINSAKTELIGTSSTGATSSTIKGAVDEAKTYADQKIAAQISSTYKAAGSIEFASLPTLSMEEEGKVYNITDAFTTNENFIEGTGKSYPAGTNVVCVDSDDAGTYKWDVLAGMVDLSAYDTAVTAQGKIDVAKQEAISTASADATSKANAAEQNAKSYADGLKSTLDESIALKADSSTVTALEERVETVEGEIETLQTSVGEVDGKISTAIGALDKADSAIKNQFVTSVSEENGVITVSRAQPEISNVNGLQGALDAKANDSDISTVGKTGNITDLIANGTIILNCGSSSTVLD